MGRKDPRLVNDSKLARMRVARGLTQAQLAAMVGCTPVDISRWERGVHQMSAQRMAQLAAALECEITDILDLDGPDG